MFVFSLLLQNMDRISRLYEIQRRLETTRKSSIPMVSPYFHLLAGSIPRRIGQTIFQISVWVATWTNFVVAFNLAIPKQLDYFSGQEMILKGVFGCNGGVRDTNEIHIIPISSNGMMNIVVCGVINVLESQYNADLFTQNIYDQIKMLCNDDS
jgi:hypothetical protein